MVNTYWHSDVAAHSACLDKLRGDMISSYQLRLPHLKPRHGWWICATFDDGSWCDILVAAWEQALLIQEKVGN